MKAQTKFNYVDLSKMTKMALANFIDPHARGEFKRIMYKAELEYQVNRAKKMRDPSSTTKGKPGENSNEE